MTAGRPKDKPDIPSPKSPGKPDSPLLTSNDLFGDMVDAPPAELPPDAAAAAARREPIRVQISEPEKEGAPPKPKSPLIQEAGAEEMAALLDVLEPMPSQPTAPAPPPAPQAAPKPAPAPLPVAPPTPPPQPKFVAPPLVAPPPPRVAPPAPAPAPPRPVAAAPRVPPPAPVPPPVPRAKPEEHPSARTATKFAAVTPKQKPTDAPGVDLASVAEGAISSVTPPPGSLQAPKFVAPAGVRGAVEKVYGPYRLLEKVAVGGMAEVFKAKRTGVEGFEKVVAVKRILPHLSNNKEFVDMFVNEAKMVAGLTHPNIVQIFDLGKIDPTYYIAMEYVHGRDLRSIMKRAKERGARIPMDLSVLIVREVCSALEYAHRKKDSRGRPLRIIHRDVSPQNILISYEGDVKLTDFGIAKAAARATTTDRGALRGKLLYMSPEQANGKPMDHRSDVFSLGIVFYEMLTDRRPFIADSERSILDAVRECRVAPPAAINPRVPPQLDRIVMKALARDPDERYQEASDMYKDLEKFLREGGKSLTQLELARFMEVLFDEKERGATLHDEPTGSGSGGGENRPVGGDLEMEFEPDPEPQPPAAFTALDDPQTLPPGSSVQSLLKKFGLK